MTKKLTKPIAFLSAVAMLLTMLLYLPSGVFSDIGLGLSASAETITPTEPSKDANGVYQITTAAELYWFSGLVNQELPGGDITFDNLASAKLMNDITVNENLLASLEYDAEGNVTNGADFTSWKPIGKSYLAYNGTFDGNGKTVSGLFFDNSSEDYVGLFGYIGNGKVTDVRVADSYIRGKIQVGGVCGYNSTGEITKCSNSGTIVGVSNTGGVCGCNYETAKDISDCYNEGTIIGADDNIGGVCGTNGKGLSDCYNTGKVTGDGWHVGGLCGVADGTLTNCYNTGDVCGTGSRAGGVCGLARSGSMIENCYTIGNVNGSSYVGGVCGDGSGKITNSYSIGDVSGSGSVGGVCGYAYSGNIIVNCYSLGQVSGGQWTGGTCGYNAGTLANCYFNSTAYTGNAVGKENGSSADILGKEAETFANGEVAYLLSKGYTVGEGESAVVYDGSVWGQKFGTDEYPVLGGATVYYDENDENSSYHNHIGNFCEICDALKPNSDGVYEISNAGQLYWFAALVNGGNTYASAKLMNDITVNENLLASLEYDEEGNVTNGTSFTSWTPIGISNVDCQYNGTFDGNGKTVSGLFFDDSTADYVGLFGYIGSGKVTDVKVADSYIRGGSYVGGVCGYVFYGSVKNCYNAGTVSGIKCVGGVCGLSENTIANCYNAGTVSGNESVGGVCGYTFAGTVENCYNAGTVSGIEYVGGVCGQNDYASITNCYFDSTVFNGNAFGTNGGTITNVEGKTTARFKSGEVCYLLSQGEDGSVWGQMLGTDKYPVLGGETVYYDESLSYHNHIANFCEPCDALEPNSDGVYEITNAAELYWFAALVNGTLESGEQDNSASAKLMNDITVNEDLLASLEYDKDGNVSNGASFSKWTPIGISTVGYQYKGTFDGNGKTVSGLFYDNSTTNYAGLFGYIDSGKVTGVKVADSYIRGKIQVGGVCGRNVSGEITNCSNSGTVVGTETVGGVCGCNYETAKDITDCYNEGAVIGTGDYIGGVCGDNYLGCSGCYNTGSVSGDWYVSGVCGSVKGELINCYNTGDISATGNKVGGVCGATNRADAKITGCYNTGNITSTVDDKFHIGGVCGYLWGEMTGCYNTGKVSTTGTEVGGVCGFNTGTVKSCYNLGNVSGKTNIGGVCGCNEGSTIVNCYSLGEVSGDEYIGGVCGNNGGAIANCYFNSKKYTGNAIGDDYSQNTVNVSGKASASFANGEVAYLLSQGHTVGEGESAVVYDGSVWGQNLEADNYPVLGGDKVYQNETYAGCIHKPGDIIYVYANESKAATYASFTEVTDKEVPATCTETGLTEGSHCSVCGEVLVAQETVKATGHSYTTKVVAPTYAAKGYTLHTCSKCGDSYKDTYTAQLVLPNVTGLKMTANTPNSISMSWTKVPNATGYVVYQAIDGKWQRIKVTSGNTLTVSNLKAGTNYRFTVKAYKTVSGTNYYCAGYTGVWMTTLPAKPSAKMTVNTPQAIRLEWGKVTGATGYVVYQQVNGSWVKKATTTNNVYVATGLKSGTNYNFAVRAYRTFNGKNYYSPFATATDTIKTCTKPATVNFTLTAGTKKATVNWSKVTGATGYIVYYKTSANGSWQRLTTTTGTTFTKTGLTTGKTYYFTVKAYKTFNGATYNASFTTKSVKVK